jgi:hypothetical protein
MLMTGVGALRPFGEAIPTSGGDPTLRWKIGFKERL